MAIDSATDTAAQKLAVTRLVIGAVQGLALYLLYSAGDARVWPATNPYLFLPLCMVIVFVPLLISQGLSVMRLKTLLVWAACAAVMLAIFGFYNRYRIWLPDVFESNATTGIANVNQPNEGVLIFSVAALFITHGLIAAGDAARKWIAPYTLYFEAASKQAVQLGLSLAFTGAFWLVLFLGAQLFKLIGLTFFETLIEKAWFAIPATTLAFAAAVHVTDARGNIIEGVRSIALTLLSWLLPLLAALAASFLIALLFTGLTPLWNTRSAASILLLASAALVILCNAAFQDGDAARSVPMPMKLGGYVAGFVLLPFVLIAAYAIYLRVAQYGWTGDRISAAAVTVVALTLGGGYLAADILALRKRDWRQTLERTNIAAAMLSVFVIICLFTPIADPQRIAVNSQVARLQAGAVTPEKFDFAWLRWQSGRFGHDALVQLSASGNAGVAKLAGDALKSKERYQVQVAALPADEARRQITVFPRDYPLPQTLLSQPWELKSGAGFPACLRASNTPCDVFPVELTGDTRDELLFVWGPQDADGWDASILSRSADGKWSVLGTVAYPHCKAARQALRAGQYHPVAPLSPPAMSIDAADNRLDIMPIRQPAPCPAK